MQWSQIKSLFILTFLILNVFLFIQFYEKQKHADIPMLEREESTIEQKLENENITFENLPEEPDEEPFVSVGQRMFTDEDMQKLATLGKQQTSLVTKTFLVSLFEEVVQIPEEAPSKVIEDLIKSKIIFPNEYMFWNWNKELNVLIFFQEKNDRPIFYNQSGMILVFLNDENEVAFYTQTMLGEAESRQDKKSLIPPIKAIEVLYTSNELRPGDEITKMDIGLHSRVPLSDGVQVFVPAWKVTVNKDKSFFVNAIEGYVFPSNELKYLEDVIVQDIERIRTNMLESELKHQILGLFDEKLTVFNRGGKE